MELVKVRIKRPLYSRSLIVVTRQIGGWVDTQYVSPSAYWIKLYRVTSDNTIVLNTTTTVPDAVHGELERISVFEHDTVC